MRQIMATSQMVFVFITLFSILKLTVNLCPNNCAQCSNTYLCTQCETGYYLATIDVGNSCQPCPFNCAICNIAPSNNIVCSHCMQNSQMNTFGVCFTCEPKCGKCQQLPQNCTECSENYQLLNQTGFHCIQKYDYGLHNCQNYDYVSYSSAITCNDCQNGFYNFRKDCDKCYFPCQSCSFDRQYIWNNQVLSFWVDAKQRLIQKIISFTSRRLLQTQRPIDPIFNNSEQNEYGADNYTETYTLWNITTWNSTVWTSEPLTNYSGMDRSRLKGWMEAYFIFQAVSAVINVNINLIDVIYRCLPLMQQLLSLTNAKSGQWNHIARHISNVTNKTLNPRMFQNLVVQKSAMKTKCLSCQIGYYLIQSNGTCQRCPFSCEKCSSSSTCIKCESGYFLFNASSCSKCSQNCLECSNNANNCTSCSSTLYLVDSKCVSCDQRCHGCLSNQTSTCIQCKFPYSLMASSSGVCYRCSQLSCERCLQLNVSKCLQCTSGYFNSYGTCIRCNVQNCHSCYSEQCIVCNDGYQLQGGMCKKCGQGCLKCSQSNMTKCVKCQLGRYFYPLDSSCKLCPKYCVTCNSSYSCLIYRQGFVLYKNRVQKCHIGCKICSSSNPAVCLECQSKYYLYQGICRLCNFNCSQCSVNNSCLPCMSSDSVCQNCLGNCLTCESNNTNCLSCKSGYLLLNKTCNKQCGDGCSECTNSLNNNIRCIRCKPNFVLNQQSGICVNCLENCYGICDPTNINHCIKCSVGFQLVSSAYCKKCNTGCIQCQNGDCSTCQNGYKLTQTQTGAIVCSKLCKFPCQVCRQQSCLSCAIGYTLNNLTSSCVADLSCNPNCQLCVEGTYKNVNNTCVLCPTNCAKCVDTSCFICHEGFYLSSNGICIQCQEPCDMCYTATKCKSCKDGYVLQILSLQNLVSTNQQLLFGDRCVKCSGNCKTCNFLQDLCLSCYPGMILRGNKCVGKYGIKFDIFLNKNFTQFLRNSQITSIIFSLCRQLNLNQNNISIGTVSQSSTRITGYISCSSQADSTVKKTVLQNMATVGGIQIIDSNYKILVNNYEQYSDDRGQQKNRKIISNEEWNKIGMWIGIGIGVILGTVIGVAICCWCSRKKKVQNIDSIKEEVEMEKADKYEVITGAASDNINIE